MMQQIKPNITPLKYVLPIMLAFSIVSAMGIYNHELWLDEAQHFLIARDSDSLVSLYYNMQYDGHVRLWNYLLYFITHYISASPLAMQAFHWLIICSTVFIFLRNAPFDIITKLLIISGYFFLFEYNLISRNYALGIFFLFVCCRLLANENKNVWWIGLMLILMSNTHMFFDFAAAGIFIYILLHRVKQKSFDSGFYILLAFFIAAITSVIIQIHIPSDNAYFHPEQTEWSSGKNIVHAFYGMAKGFLIIPFSINGDFWNHFLFDKLPFFLKLPLTLGLMIYLFLLLRKSRPALVFYSCCVFLLLSFLFIAQIWASRYFGMFFIYFIAAAWLAGNESIDIFSVKKLAQKPLKSKLFYGTFYLILLCHCVTGVYAYASDIRKPFTEAKNTAAYLQSKYPSDKIIVVDGYGAGPSLSAYLGRKVFYLNLDAPGSFCYWKTSYFDMSKTPLAEQLMKSAYISSQNDFLLVSSREATKQVRCDSCVFEFKKLADFKDGIIRPDYYVYHVMKKVSNSVATN